MRTASARPIREISSREISRREISDAADPVHAAIRRARRPLPPHELGGANYRRWAAAVCAAEARHAADDFWSCVHRLGIACRFDRDDRFGGHEAPFRLPHEVHACAALSWLSHLQAHESDRRGPWAAVRWNTWDAGERRDWFARRRILWAGFVRQVERYRAARRRLRPGPGGSCSSGSAASSRPDVDPCPWAR